MRKRRAERKANGTTDLPWWALAFAGEFTLCAAGVSTSPTVGFIVSGLAGRLPFSGLRHYYASMLIKSGGDVKVVQARLRHASAKTTLDTYSHLWPDSDDSTRAAIDSAMAAREGDSRAAADGDA